jgi:hypothetical protein
VVCFLVRERPNPNQKRTFLFQIALNLWNSTGNVLTWLHKYSQTSDAKLEFSSVIETTNGLNSKVAEKICKTTFRNDIAIIQMEVSDPRILEVVRHKKVSFPEMLGTVGKLQYP